jgi:hypothetical protein
MRGFLITILFPLIVTAQEASWTWPLSEEQQKAYTREKLSVEIQGMTLGSYSASLYSGTFAAASWRRWTAYQGFEPLSEVQFFALTGYPREAAQAQSYKSNNDAMTAVGCVLGIVGGVVAIVGATKKTTTHYDYGYGIQGDIEESDPSEGMVLGGLVVSTVGWALMYSGIVGSSKNWAPAAVVQEIADTFNKKVLQEIKNKK